MNTVKYDDTEGRKGKGKKFSLKSTSLKHNAKRAACLPDDPGTPASVEAAGALAGAAIWPHTLQHTLFKGRAEISVHKNVNTLKIRAMKCGDVFVPEKNEKSFHFPGAQ